MKYTDLAGREVSGDVWSQGPKLGTVWVRKPLGDFAVVNASKKTEVEYTAPPVPASVPHPMVEQAVRVHSEWETIRKQFAALGPVTPLDADVVAAGQFLRIHERCQRDRLPFINAHGPQPKKEDIPYQGAPKFREAVGEKRFKELAAEGGEDDE